MSYWRHHRFQDTCQACLHLKTPKLSQPIFTHHSLLGLLKHRNCDVLPSYRVRLSLRKAIEETHPQSDSPWESKQQWPIFSTYSFLCISVHLSSCRESKRFPFCWYIHWVTSLSNPSSWFNHPPRATSYWVSTVWETSQESHGPTNPITGSLYRLHGGKEHQKTTTQQFICFPAKTWWSSPLLGWDHLRPPMIRWMEEILHQIEGGVGFHLHPLYGIVADPLFWKSNTNSPERKLYWPKKRWLETTNAGEYFLRGQNH